MREEFHERCIYCCMPDAPQTPESFCVEHYRPKGVPEFDHLELVYENLFYACSACNRRKWKHWPTAAELANNEFFPNPCDHVMFEHLKYKGAVVELRSKAGRYANKYLDLNDPKSVEYREIVLDEIYHAEVRRRKAQEMLIEIDKTLAIGKTWQLEDLKRRAEFNISRADKTLKFFGAA